MVKRSVANRLGAMTLLETLLAMSLLAMLAVVGAQAVRLSWQALEIQDQRAETSQHLTGLLSHLTRHLRTVRHVVNVTAATDTSGDLKVEQANGSIVNWKHYTGDSTVQYKVDSGAYNLLATGIDTLKFECFQIDGVTPTTVLADIRMIRATASITVPVQGTSQSLSTDVWIRKQQDTVAAFDDFYATNSATPIGWSNHGNTINPPDGLLSYGGQGATIRAFGFDPGTNTGAVGTVLVGFLLKTDSTMDADLLDVQVDRGLLGPIHSFDEQSLMRFTNNLDWFWIDVTDDFAGWLYEDLSTTRIQITNRDAGSDGATIYLDSVKMRTFANAPVTQTFWMTGLGTGTDEWVNQMGAVGPPDAFYAQSGFTGGNDHQSYAHAGSWADQGTVIRVRLLMNFYVSTTFVDDELKTHLAVLGTGLGQGYPLDVPLATLNQHIGIANQGTEYLDFSGFQDWTWPDINSREVRFHAKQEAAVSDGTIYMDAVGIEVRYVPPDEAAVVLWEEL